MKDLAWYRSHIIDPYQDDAIADQADVNQQWDMQYKCDAISENIGTAKCRTTVNLFIDEVLVGLDTDALTEFFRVVFDKLISVYHLDYLQDFADNKRSMDYPGETLKLLMFCEKDYLPVIADIVTPIFDLNKKIGEQTIKDNFNSIYSQLQVKIKELPYLLQEFFTYGALDDMVHFITTLLMKEYWIIESMIVSKQLSEGVINNGRN